MPYVIRDADGKIVQVLEQPVTGAVENIAADADEIQAFHKAQSDGTAEALRRQLAQSDTGMARLVEDLIDLLISKGTIKFNDLQAAAGAKYLECMATRQRLQAVQSIIVDAGDII